MLTFVTRSYAKNSTLRQSWRMLVSSTPRQFVQSVGHDAVSKDQQICRTRQRDDLWASCFALPFTSSVYAPTSSSCPDRERNSESLIGIAVIRHDFCPLIPVSGAFVIRIARGSNGGGISEDADANSKQHRGAAPVIWRQLGGLFPVS